MKRYDVAIIGGGPAGSTCATLLKKYAPELEVLILERECFPRDHIGESLLPPISAVLNEMGCWDKIEAANFPIKVGATYRWGKQPELWNYEFLPVESFREEPRPAKFEGQRTRTAFQVDRSIYDKILLDHAAEGGCEVRQATKVTFVRRDGDRIAALEPASGETVEARHYVDASGNCGVLRRAMEVGCQYPSSLKNIAVYDYWQNAEWAVEIGVGATRIQVLSVPYGWIWFIPMGPTRTSVGLVVPADYYKQSGVKPEELYLKALSEEAIVAGLLRSATREDRLTTTRDWSFLADRHFGENWFLVGESAGFADPILSAGVTMAHVGAQQLAYTILDLDRGTHGAEWLKAQFESRQKQRIRTHIRFGDFWYTSNSQLTGLKQFTSQLASDVGLELNPESAWDWISRGGFIDEDLVGQGGFALGALKSSGPYLTEIAFDTPLEKNNVFVLDLTGADTKEVAHYAEGRVEKRFCYVRGDRVLPVGGNYEMALKVLRKASTLPEILAFIETQLRARNVHLEQFGRTLSQITQPMEAMIRDGWVKASYDPRLPLLPPPKVVSPFRLNREPIHRS